tara:strand:+ start:350 stop:676 length:327 start_codon:yes stop_codon:yes gene_type:complete
MIKKFKLFITFIVIIFSFSSCGTIKEGFSSQKKDNNDEFLVEKKSPLLLPPDFEDFPVPNSTNSSKNNKKNGVKELLTKSKNDSTNTVGSEKLDKTFSESLLDKIKNK